MVFLRGVTAKEPGEGRGAESSPGRKNRNHHDFTDAWFIGFSPSISCGVWVGYDDRQSLGDKADRSRRRASVVDRFHEDRDRRDTA